jgi:dihydropteroate synthase
LSLESPRVMGILNMTPDSFSDGGGLSGVTDALRRAEVMAREGADLLDVGGESTRPGAALLSEEEELRRVAPVVRALVREIPLPVSVDTRKAAVAQAALDAGAQIVNDVSGLAFDRAMGTVVARASAGVVLMHMRGTPADMRDRARYVDLEGEVVAELGEALVRAREAGISERSMVLDPGIGFAKTAEQSLRLLGNLAPLQALGFPLLIGASRKSFLGKILDVPPVERVSGSVAACIVALMQGVRLFRVHDVCATVEGLKVAEAIRRAGLGPIHPDHEGSRAE